VHIRRGVLLHDIGKLGVPDSILLKPGKLTDEEMALMKRHPDIAYDILSPIPFLRGALDIPYLHHEKWDDSGYPKGMRGMEIPVPSRIFAVIDVWDAHLSNRPYRSAWTEDRVIDYLRTERGRHFDPEIVGVFLDKVLPANQ
jgi:HD-GYP domain-containing protein (c-di-GMP phosphodiesterase class II)